MVFSLGIQPQPGSVRLSISGEGLGRACRVQILVTALTLVRVTQGQALTMTPEDRARFEEMCERASQELDPEKLYELAREINRILLEKRRRRSATPSNSGLRPLTSQEK